MLHYFVPLPLKQLDDTVLANEMQRSDDDQIVMIVAEQASDCR